MLWSRTEKQRPIYQKTRLFFNTLKEELTCLYMPKTDNDQQQPTTFSLSLLPDGGVKLSFLTINPSWKNTYLSNLPAKGSKP